MNLRELIDEVDVPTTRVAEGTWERARGRVRRRRWVTAGAAGLAVAAVAVAVSVLPGSERADGPADPPSTDMVITTPDWEELAVNRVPAPSPDADPLSVNPVRHAALAVADPDDEAGAYVLGDDGDWRHLDVDGLVPVRTGIHIRALVRSTSLDEAATRLAIPQPGGLLVVDLTSGDAQRYDVPGQNTYALWHDESHVLVAGETDATGTLVNLDTGNVEPSTYGPSTRVLPDGSALTWGDQRDPIEWSDGRVVTTPANNVGGVFPEPPLVSDEIVVGLHAQNASPGELSEADGVVAVDADTGAPVAFLPLRGGEPTSLLGWAGDLPILGLVRASDGAIQTHVVTWDYRNGELYPLAVLSSARVAWGVGL